MATRFAFLTLAVLAATVLLAPDAFAKGWGWEDYLQQKPLSDWDGFGVGTTLHNRMSQEVMMPGATEPQVQTMEERKTLVEITDTEFVLKVEKRAGDGEWRETESREPRNKGITPKVEELGEDTVTIGDTSYPCVKKKVVWMKGEEVDESETLWIHAEHGILLMEKHGDQPGTITVTDLDASIAIGEATVPGRAMALVMKTPQGMELTGTAQMSLTVPENIVHHEIHGAQGPVSVKIALETIAFEKK